MFYPQTNIQLYNQLQRAGWAEDDLRQVRSAYQLAMRVAAGHFRPNEKPALAHLVGVAGILAQHGAPATLVSAGLLHSVYSQGEFGDSSRGMNEDKRREVRRSVGAACEQLVARYAVLSWDLTRLEILRARVANLSPVDQALVFMRLADLLEDHHDSGMLYAPPESRSNRSEPQTAGCTAVVQLAALLGHEQLASELAEAFCLEGANVPGYLQARHSGSFVIAPMSHSERPTVRLGRLYRQVRDKLTPVVREPLRKAA